MSDADLDFRLLFESSPDILLVLRADPPRYTMIGATESRLAATHTTRADILDRGLFEVFPDNPDDPSATGANNLRASLDRVVATRQSDTMAVQKYDIRGPDGTFQIKYWSPRNLPVLSASGELRYILHRVEDVTELVRASELGQELLGRTHAMEREVIRRSGELAEANRELRAANAKLGELDAAKTAFFSNISHEFRTPLTLMLGPLEDCLAESDERLAPAQRARLRMAFDNSLRLLKLVNALLDFARLEAGRLSATFSPLDLSAATAELAGMFQSALEKAGLRLVLECPKLDEPAWVDRELWEKIVSNLMSNAFKFTLAGQVTVRVSAQPTQFVLEVSDTGVGIPQSELGRVFERFHRVTGVVGRTYEGSGIGLALVRELVELHGGRVGVTSAVGAGTAFRVEIPRGFAHLPPDSVSHGSPPRGDVRAAEAQAGETRRLSSGAVVVPNEPGPAAPSPGVAPAQVLVVDDNPDLRDYLARILAPAYEVTTACDGRAALASVRARRPDIVVSDVMMPLLDGFGLVRELRSDPSTAAIPVILLSARAGEDSALEGLDAGANDYLMKPFAARELLARVRTNVELARARRAWTLELENANHELEAFNRSVAHDLRAPVRIVAGFAQVLLEDFGDALGAEGAKSLAHIRAAAVRMGELIEGLLALSRLGRGEVARAPVDLSSMARRIVERLELRDPGRRVEVEIEPAIEVNADARLVEIALENLLGNAWKFTGKTAAARILVGQRAEGSPKTVFVRDNGAGFDMKYVKNLFGVFQRLHAASDFEGTGIGLATVERVVRRHGGRIWAEGAVGRGATFSFTFDEARD